MGTTRKLSISLLGPNRTDHTSWSLGTHVRMYMYEYIESYGSGTVKVPVVN